VGGIKALDQQEGNWDRGIGGFRDVGIGGFLIGDWDLEFGIWNLLLEFEG